MSIVVGYQPGHGGDEALELGAGLAVALATDLVLVTATPKPWTTPSMARVDAEFSAYSRRYGDDAEAAAHVHLSRRFPGIPAAFHQVRERSVSKSLHKILGEHDADILVLGTSHGTDDGRMSLGATTGRFTHSSAVPLALAPKGYTCTGISRLTCAYSGDEHGVDVVLATGELAQQMSVPLRVATFGVRPADMFPPEVGLDAERTVMEAWKEQMAASMNALVADHIIGPATTTTIGTGGDWDTAFDAIGWTDGDLLTIGTTPRDPIKRVFLGSRAAKIVAASTVPAIVFPG
ncbi:universal stress protein [Williamsia sp.]|uniref:universal stress protein n=1 Tax=Williamsia sp. TaxID=1872085 RepID=UPI002F95815E